MAGRLRQFLEAQGVGYELVPHEPAATSTRTAQAAHVPGRNLAKAVVVEDGSHCAVVVLPATEQVHLGEMRLALGDTYALATEDGVRRVFADCEPGPVPAFGQPYGVEVLLDDSLLDCDRVFMESGERGALLSMRGADFRRLMRDARHGHFAEPA